MTGEVINLRRVRKAKSRADAEAQAAANRIAYGFGKPEKRLKEARDALDRRRHEGHRLTRASDARTSGEE